MRVRHNIHQRDAGTGVLRNRSTAHDDLAIALYVDLSSAAAKVDRTAGEIDGEKDDARDQSGNKPQQIDDKGKSVDDPVRRSSSTLGVQDVRTRRQAKERAKERYEAGAAKHRAQATEKPCACSSWPSAGSGRSSSLPKAAAVVRAIRIGPARPAWTYPRFIYGAS